MESGAFMKKAIIMVTLIFSIGLANRQDFPAIGIPEAYSSLPKKTASNLSLKAYSSAWFNIQYTCPTGWTITDTTNQGNMFIHLTVTSPDYLATISLSAVKMNTAIEATYWGGFGCFTTAVIANKSSYPYMPGIYAAMDTLWSNGVRYKGIQIKFNSSAGYNTIGTTYTGSMDCSAICFNYYTSISDYDKNSDSYLLHWKNFVFYSSTILSKQQGLNELSIIKPNLLRENKVDVLGRSATNCNASQMFIEQGGTLKQVMKK